MCIYIYVYIYIYTYIYMHMHMHMHMHMYMYMYMCIYIYVYVYVCMCVYIYIYMYVYIYIYIYIHICICISRLLPALQVLAHALGLPLARFLVAAVEAELDELVYRVLLRCFLFVYYLSIFLFRFLSVSYFFVFVCAPPLYGDATNSQTVHRSAPVVYSNLTQRTATTRGVPLPFAPPRGCRWPPSCREPRCPRRPARRRSSSSCPPSA